MFGDKDLQSALVRSLVVPGELEAARTSAPDVIDWDTFEKFGGFITLGRHNFLWEALPLTRHFLAQTPVEMELFTAWRGCHLSARFHKRPDRDAQITAFSAFAGDFLADRPGLIWLRDILVHESALWALRGDSKPESLDTGEASLHLRPALRGRVRVLLLSSAPSELTTRAQTALAGKASVTFDWRWYIYHVPPGMAKLRAAEIDAIAAAFIAGVDGLRTAEDIAQSVAGNIPTSMAATYFQALTREGFIRWTSSGAAQ